MKNGIREIDHLLTYVENLDQSAQTYQRLGFSLTPISHNTAMGVVNRLVLLQARTPGTANFVELMGVCEAERLPAAMRSLLSGRPGIKSMVMATPDATEAYRELSAAGYGFGPPHHVRREWVLPDGASVWPEFDVLLPIPAPLPFNVCQYHNLQLYQREDWQRHANTAVSLLAAFAVTPDPVQHTGYFEALFGQASRRTSDGGFSVTPGAVHLVIYSPDRFRSRFDAAPDVPTGQDIRYAGMRIGVADMAALKACLRDGGVSFLEGDDRTVVGPAAACGNVVEFVEQPT